MTADSNGDASGQIAKIRATMDAAFPDALVVCELPELANLSVSEINILVRWVIMVSINLEYHGNIPHTSQYQRTKIFKGEIPSGWRVSFALMVDRSCAGESFYRRLGSHLEEGENGRHCFASTYFCIENVAFHTLTA